MTTAIAELDVARQQIEIARKAVADAEAQSARMKQQMHDAVRAYLMAAEGDELIDRATDVYWNLPDVPASLVASVVLGDPKAGNRLTRILRQANITSPCCLCGSPCHVSSRSRLADIQNGRVQLACDVCSAKQAAIARREWAERERMEVERMEALHSMPYREYLLTEEWLDTRNRKLRQARFKCQLCNGGGLLNVHHRTYERRGFEDMADLIVLCRPCHAKFHDKLP